MGNATGKRVRHKLTVKNVPRFKEGEWFDQNLNGFGLRVMPSGERSFFVRYKRGATHSRITVGRYPAVTLDEARAKAQEIFRRDDGAVKRPETLSFGEVAEQYAAWLPGSKKVKRWKEVVRSIRHDLIPALGSHRFATLRKGEILSVLEAKATTAPIMANRLHERISAIYRWAIQRDLAETNPMRSMDKPAPAASRDRFLADAETKTLWLEGEKAFGFYLASIYRLILLTGQRPGNVREMEWSELEGDWWMIPRPKTKGDFVYRVALSEQAQAILEVMRGASRGPFVFENPATKRPYTESWAAHSLLDWQNPKGKDGKRLTLKPKPYTPHDLRRSFGTLLGRLGFDEHMRRLAMSHRIAGIDSVYNRYSYDAEKLEAVRAIDAHVSGLLGGTRAPGVLP